MKHLNDFIFEKLKITKDIKIKDNNNILELVDWILLAFDINKLFNKYNLFKETIKEWLEKNNIENKSDILGPYIINPQYYKHNTFIRNGNTYKRGRIAISNTIIDVSKSIGDPNNDGIILYISDKYLMLTTSPINNIKFSVYFIKNIIN